MACRESRTRAVVCRCCGSPEDLRLEEWAVPPPGPGEVRLEVAAAALNFADLLMIRGRYQERPELPFVPGLECAGEVEAVGPGVDGLEVGQRVLAVVDHGAFAERVVARALDVLPLPRAVSMSEAAALPIAFGTAHGAFTWRARLRPGETVLVTGAGGGTGLAAVAVAKRLGARVIATARGSAKLDAARAAGADHALDAEDPELVARIRAIAGERGVDVAFETVGAPGFQQALKTIAWEGRILLIGFASGRLPEIPANHLLVKNAAAIGFYWGSYRRRDPARLRAGLATLLSWLAEGSIRPRVDQQLPLAQAPAALKRLAEAPPAGKIVLTIP